MKKKILLRVLTLMALLFLPAQAIIAHTTEENVTCMVLTMTDGTVNKFALNESPKVTYQGDNLVVESSTGEFTTAMSGISTFTFELVPVGISEMDNAPQKPVLTPGKASFEGLKAGATISIYTTDGKMLSSVKADGEGFATVDLGTLPQGVYILRTPNQSYKIKK